MTDTLTAPVGRSAKSPNTNIPNRRPDVQVVQRLLNGAHGKAGIPKSRLAEDGIIGPKTLAAIIEFQQANFGWHDGVVEPNRTTFQKLLSFKSGPPGPAPAPGGNSLAEQAVVIAIGEDGVREEPLGSNGGPRVMEYLRSVGLNSPDLWCMAFVYWCFNQAAGRVGAVNPLRRTASCSQQFAWGQANNRLVQTPQRGDIFLVRGGAAGRTHQHTGIVTGGEAGRVLTVEGNTNNDGSRNGIGVFRRSRAAAGMDYIRVG